MIHQHLPRRAIRGALLGAALAIAGCASTPTIKTDFDQTVDFGRFHTYSWAYSAAPRGMNPLLFERVRTSIDRGLTARGFTPAQEGAGDFAVAFTVGRRDSVQVTDLGPYGPYFRGGWGWGGGWGRSNVDVRNVTDGTLVIDIYDAATRKPVWHGMATQQINPSRIDETQVNAAIDAVLARFPPQPGS